MQQAAPLLQGMIPPAEYWQPRYFPSHLSHVTQVFENGQINLQLVVYLPLDYGPTVEQSPASDLHNSASIQVKVGSTGTWQNLQYSPSLGKGYWSLELIQISPRQPLRFRYRDNAGQWRPIMPISDLENVRGTTYVPNLSHEWKNQPPRFNHGKVLMETTLEGLIAGYKGGRFAPKSFGDMFQMSIAQRILKTNIPRHLVEWGIDEIMVPVCSSVADRSYLDPKFNYLTYNVADVDWQIGESDTFMRLIDQFYAHGILIVPDLIFAHQVKNPFDGSLDQVVQPRTGERLVVDTHAYLFRDYGTWMFKLADPAVRQQLAEKISAFVAKFRLRMIRIDYVDGLILQYSDRRAENYRCTENYGETFIRELRAELKRAAPDVVVLGETFEVAGNPAVQEFIDVFYAPVGFSIVEELYKPPGEMARPQYPDVNRLIAEINWASQSSRREAVYAQLHDETWYDQHIVRGRPYVPWAYGGNPAQLAKLQGEKLVDMGLLQPSGLLDYVRRTVRNAEALTMFTARLRYMFVPGVDSLCLGRLDDPDQWKMIWDGVTPSQMGHWKATGLGEVDILKLHGRHRADMIALRQIFRRYTLVAEDTLQPLTTVSAYHADPETSVLGLLRFNPFQLSDTLLVVFNFGPRSFAGGVEQGYELPISLNTHGQSLAGTWEILFDGDWVAPENQRQGEAVLGYAPGSQLQTTTGQYLNNACVLNFSLGAVSLVVLRYLSGVS